MELGVIIYRQCYQVIRSVVGNVSVQVMHLHIAWEGYVIGKLVHKSMLGNRLFAYHAINHFVQIDIAVPDCPYVSLSAMFHYAFSCLYHCSLFSPDAASTQPKWPTCWQTNMSDGR